MQKEAVKHTPGPWGITYCKTTRRKYITVAKDRLIPICDTNGRIGALARMDDDLAEANARLIAAAPDLLEACEEALGFIDELKNCNIEGFSEESRIREAIAKAKGES